MREPRKRDPRWSVRPADVGADGKTLYTVGQAAKFLGVSRPAVRYMLRESGLPHEIRQGIAVMERDQLEAFKLARFNGAKHALAFKLFREGATLSEVIERCEIDVANAQWLADHYERAAGAIMVPLPKPSLDSWQRAFGLPFTAEALVRVCEIAARSKDVRAFFAESRQLDPHTPALDREQSASAASAKRAG